MVHLIPCKTDITAEETADLFIKHVWMKHGTPTTTISDRGTQFNNKFLRALYDKLGIQPRFSTAYHPQTDGQTERMNQEIETFLRIYCNHRQDDWDTWLPFAEFAHNNARSSTTGELPFYANYGFHPNMNIEATKTNMPASDNKATTLRDIRSRIKEMQLKANERMTKWANSKQTTESPYKEGQRVLLQAKNIKTDRPTAKLDYKYIGLYVIDKKISNVAFRLKLLHTMKVHPVFHVSLLKPYKQDIIPGRKTSEPPAVITPQGEEEWEVDAILNTKKVGRGLHYLIKWAGFGPEHNSWEPYQNITNAKALIHDFHSRYPIFGVLKHP